ncbi:wax ester/triacylglycerol synthase domain-containing protein [Nonomuraea sp. NPDC048892]|uniref:wax ester/triacylglycerol synthase domain-containing protein n=1 Tax=Nonomuraea sp. NPDC048892 TaxID=3154624 RepID=UPI0033E715DA
MKGESAAGAVPLTFGDYYAIRLGAGAVHDSRMHCGLAVRRPGPPPDPESLRELVAERVRVAAPALTYRVAGRGRHACWEPDPGFDAAHHVEFHRLPRVTYQAVVDAMRLRPLSWERPLWSLMVLYGEPGEGHVVCYRAHHAFQDGMGVVAAARALLSTGTLPPPTEAGDDGGGPVYRGSPGPVRSALGDLCRLAAASPPWFAMHLDHGESAGGGLRLEVANLDRAAFDDVSRATGASIAQIGLALVTGAIRAWNQPAWNQPAWDAGPTPDGAGKPAAGPRGESSAEQTAGPPVGQTAGMPAGPTAGPAAELAVRLRAGSPGDWPAGLRRGLPVGLPVGLLGHRAHTGLGNHTGLLPITLPCDEPSPATRLERIAEQTTIRRIAHARRSARGLYGLPAAVAVPMLRLLSPLLGQSSPRRLGATALPVPRELAGQGEVFAVPGLPPALAGMVVIMPAGANVAISAVFDPRVARTDEFPGLLRRELTESLAPATR